MGVAARLDREVGVAVAVDVALDVGDVLDSVVEDDQLALLVVEMIAAEMEGWEMLTFSAAKVMLPRSPAATKYSSCLRVNLIGTPWIRNPDTIER